MSWISVLSVLLLAPVLKATQALFLLFAAVAVAGGLVFQPRWVLGIMAVGCAADIAVNVRPLVGIGLSASQIAAVLGTTAFAWLVWTFILAAAVRLLRRSAKAGTG